MAARRPGRGGLARQHSVREPGFHLRSRRAQKGAASFNLGAGAGFEKASTARTEDTADSANSFTVDDTEYNIFNTDRRLEALRSIACRSPASSKKKSLIYFSSGMDRTGIENESRAALGHERRGSGQHVHLHHRTFAACRPASRRRGAKRQPARRFPLLWRDRHSMT